MAKVEFCCSADKSFFSRTLSRTQKPPANPLFIGKRKNTKKNLPTFQQNVSRILSRISGPESVPYIVADPVAIILFPTLAKIDGKGLAFYIFIFSSSRGDTQVAAV